MPKSFPHILLLCCCFLSMLYASCQDKSPVEGNFRNMLFKDFVAYVESKSLFHFYYDNNTLDSLNIDITETNLSLSLLLQKIFANTAFQFAIDSANRVFITSFAAIHTALPSGYFDRTNGNDHNNEASQIFAGDQTVMPSTGKKKEVLVGKASLQTSVTATITGYIRESKTGETIAGATVYIDTPAIGTATDQYGYYSLTLPTGHHILHISGMGMREHSTPILLSGDGKLNIELDEYIPSLKAVMVTADIRSNLRNIQMGVERLSIQTIRKIPVVFGETDLLRVIMTLPGVSSVGEASTGFNVRGGAADQNLVLFSNATIYNPSHLFGFFAAFNPDVVKSIELYKSGIPEKYGGRLASVLDVTVKDGNNKKVTGIGGIGLLTSKLTIEGPLAKDKTSFIVGGRTTYSNWLLKQVPNDAYRNSKASFADGNLQVHHIINSKNDLHLMGYLSSDRFNLRTDTTYSYGNRNANIQWKHLFNNKWNSILIAGFDHYHYTISGGDNTITGFQLGFSVDQPHARLDFNWQPNSKHTLNFGLQSVNYRLQPGVYKPLDQQSLVKADRLQKETGWESAIYLGDKFNVTPKLTVSAGVRYAVYQFLGPHTVYQYASNIPKDTAAITGSISYQKGKIIQTYHGPSFRLAGLYKLNNQASIKLSFNSLQQFIHVLSNTTAISPTDIYKLSDPHIQPQRGYQLSAGYYRNFRINTIETSLEIYYKNLQHSLDYKSGASLLMNHYIETDIINTKGMVYGAELLIKKTEGKINGWISYTYSRSLLQTDDPIAGETINKGEWYPANFDKPHNIHFIGNYRFSHRFSTSLNVTYNTGRPITLPLAMFNMGGSQRLFYSERNAYRIPDYFRTDISFTMEGNHKLKQLTHNSWSLGVYNLTGRKNAYSVYFVQQNGNIKGYQLSIFGTLIPFLTYNFRF